MKKDEGSARERLRARYDDLQRQVAHSLVVGQELIDTRDRLDRDVTRLKAIQAYSRRAIRAERLQDFAHTTAEAIIEAFEVDCSAVLVRDETGRSLEIVASFGLGEEARAGCRPDMEWVRAKGLHKGGAALIEQVDSDAETWESTGLAQIIACPVADQEGACEGLLVGGVSVEKEPYYGSIGEEMVPSFVVFAEQVQSLLHNLRSRKTIREQIGALAESNVALEEKTGRLQLAQEQLEKTNRDLERRVAELSTLYATGTAIASILNMEQLLEAVLKAAVNDLGYDRAMIMLVDTERKVLANGHGFGGTEEMVRFVERLEIPIAPGAGGLARVALTGESLLVEDALDSEAELDAGILRALKTRSFLAVPLKTAEQVTGVIAVDNFETGAELGADDSRLLMTLASQVAIAIENARLVERGPPSARWLRAWLTRSGIPSPP